MDFWRSFFQSSDHDIWTVIDKAIAVAASDFPLELKSKRDGFAEKLFAPSHGKAAAGEARPVVDESCRQSEVSQAKNMSVTPEHDYEQVVVDRRSGNRTCSFEEVGTLSDKVDQDGFVLKEFTQVKKQLLLSDVQDEELVLKLLKRLDALQASYSVLKTTEIGKPVNPLRKHSSIRIRSLAKKLVRSWAAIADDWVESLKSIRTPPRGCRIDRQSGLPTPPIDKGELDAALEMSPSELELGSPMEMIDTVPSNLRKRALDQISHGSNYSPAQLEKIRMQKKVENPRKNTTGSSPSVSDALAAAKRKLHEGYQRIENEKKQRVVQVMQLEDLPKGQGPKPARRTARK